jgi:predicted HAD superfamily Cof-like phosphohydrolase
MKICNPWVDVLWFMQSGDQATTHNDTKQAELYKTLIDEEHGEFTEAFKNKDDVEIADACFDMIWVIIGYMYSRGWDPIDIWEEGKISNHKKIDPITNTIHKREDGKILKPEGWTPPNFSKLVK